MDCRRGSILSPGRCIESDPNPRVRYAMHSNRTHQQQPTVLPPQARLPGQPFSTNPSHETIIRTKKYISACYTKVTPVPWYQEYQSWYTCRYHAQFPRRRILWLIDHSMFFCF